ncbi:MAG: type II toxin-antitoxin system MqsA family antitoxin [Planctomycetota bacterium]
MPAKRITNCDLCGTAGARVRRVTRTFGRGAAAFLIENVPMVTCAACGESYFTAETLREVEHIRVHWRQLTVKKRVPVARFGGAA